MKNQFKLILQLLFLVGITSCGGTSKSGKLLQNLQSVSMQYANSFRLDTCPEGKQLTILNPKDTSLILSQFILRNQDYDEPLQANEIKVPCKRIVCLSSTQLAYIIELDALESVVGINSSRHLFNRRIKARVESQEVARVGKEGVFDVETIIALHPDLIFVSPFKAGGYSVLKNLGIPLVPMAAYGENNPLGRAEWIKMLALFTGKTAETDQIFDGIATEYERVKALAAAVDHRPTIFSGKMKGGIWYVPGGNSFYAHFFRDAGAEYVVKNQKTIATPMDYETVYEMANNTDYWRLLTSSASGFNKRALKAEDVRYADFKAFRTGNILLCNLREVPYREESCVKPQILLSDYVYHFHPELMADYQPTFWTKINE